MFEVGSTEQGDLRGGHAPWSSGARSVIRSRISSSFHCQILVVGGGITGSLVAQHLASIGYQVCIIDRERPGHGSTAASTAMLQWEIDQPLDDLTIAYGFEAASMVYRTSLAAVSGLEKLVLERGLQCGWRSRRSLYLSAAEVGANKLSQEHRLRTRAGLPGELFDHRRLLSEFKIDREAAIYSPGSADANPLLLSKSLMADAVFLGAELFDAEALGFDESTKAVSVAIDNGLEIEAEHVVLATGYVMPDFVRSDLHKIASSWAIATAPQSTKSLWKDGALIWEASKRYHYARTTNQGRIIIGGEDDDQVVEASDRDKMMPAKADVLSKKLKLLWPASDPNPEFIWSGAFGTTSDGLPLIGPVPKHSRILAAYGYGGNGITFSFLASRMIANCVAGERKNWFDLFAIDRDVPRMI